MKSKTMNVAKYLNTLHWELKQYLKMYFKSFFICFMMLKLFLEFLNNPPACC